MVVASTTTIYDVKIKTQPEYTYTHTHTTATQQQQKRGSERKYSCLIFN